MEPTTSPSTVTEARLTVCTTARTGTRVDQIRWG